MTDAPTDRPHLDPGARGGLGGLVVVAAAFVFLVAWQSEARLLCGALMAAVGAAAVLGVRHVAIRRRRFFSAAEWLALGGLFTAFFLLLQAAPGAELRRFYEEDPSRQRNALVIAAVLVGIGLVSLAMLRGGKGSGTERD